MPLTPIVGDIQLRQFQLGKESTFKTAVAATRRMPWATTPGIDPHWTFPTADTGTLDQGISPYRSASDYTIGISGSQLASNDAPTIISMGVMGGLSLTTSGTAKILTAAPASTSQDVFDTYTAEWGDDSTDTWKFVGCVMDTFTLDYPQDMGPIQLSATIRGADIATYPASFTGALNVDLAPVWLYAADTEFYVNDTAGAIETTKLSDIAYSAQFSVNNNLDLKRLMNGSNTRFAIQNYGRGLRTVTFSLTGAKQSAWVSEAVKWIGASPTERFFGIKTTAVDLASAGIPHSLDIRMPGYWLTRSEQTINSNTAFQLTANNVYDSTLTYPFRMVSTSTRAAL